MRHSNLTRKNVYIVLSVFLPVLSIYASPISGMDFGTVCVLLFALVMVPNNASFKMPTLLSIILVYSFFSAVPVLLGIVEEYSSVDTIWLRVLRYIVVIVIMVGFGYTTYYEERTYIRVVKFFSIIVASYAIIQSITYNLIGIKLRNIFGPERGGAVFTSSLGEYEKVYRPPSIFLEPSGVAYFLTPFLCYILFYQKKTSRKDLLVAALISLGIVVTTSGQGLLVLALCWGTWFLIQVRKTNVFSILIALVFFVVLFYNFDFEYSTSRITTTEELNAVDARYGGYEMIQLRNTFNALESFFGSGFGNYSENVYYASFAEIIFCTGYIGFILVMIFYLSLFVKGVRYQKILVLASILLMFSGGIYTATYLCLYLPLLLHRQVPKQIHNN